MEVELIAGFDVTGLIEEIHNLINNAHHKIYLN